MSSLKLIPIVKQKGGRGGGVFQPVGLTHLDTDSADTLVKKTCISEDSCPLSDSFFISVAHSH